LADVPDEKWLIEESAAQARYFTCAISRFTPQVSLCLLLIFRLYGYCSMTLWRGVGRF